MQEDVAQLVGQRLGGLCWREIVGNGDGAGREVGRTVRTAGNLASQDGEVCGSDLSGEAVPQSGGRFAVEQLRRGRRLDAVAVGLVQGEDVRDPETRERYPYRFSHQHATTERRALPAGDYGVTLNAEIVAVVERKTVADLSGRLVDGQLAYALAELATLPRSALVVEDRYADLLNNPHVRPGFLADQLAAVTVRYPEVAIAFCDTRPLAEEWTYRCLAAALTYLRAEQDEQGQNRHI